MTLEAFGSTGNFASGVAVVITLAYLAVQTRENTRERRQQAMHAGSEWNQLPHTHPDIARVDRAGRGDPAALSGEDRSA